ncbi:hypothetical protein BN940_00551 [Castellaniella defragrans 65Phen]|uniref:Uncharacterized protein n=1 Tax=Castellaniella defragrans (strain DSM 12143 / CCUG 39792 / 65Phen) TaxID=1437824 RepID=W8X106_CASD6|nr:hypothetical protein BN940_00551 [Castellaniella defragrans 65Phen]
MRFHRVTSGLWMKDRLRAQACLRWGCCPINHIGPGVKIMGRTPPGRARGRAASSMRRAKTFPRRAAAQRRSGQWRDAGIRPASGWNQWSSGVMGPPV